MKAYYDLHIHSCLSPCGDEDMTPNNIVNMSMIKGLDIIAIADHNAGLNVKAAAKVAEKRDLLLVPAMEVQTIEEVHLLCLFRTLENLDQFQGVLDEKRLGLPNNVTKFGPQWIMNEGDEIIGHFEEALIWSIKMSLEEVVQKVRELEGIVIPAHINRKSNGMLSQLGFIPEQLNFTTVEVSGDAQGDLFLESYGNPSHFKIIRDSDAHYLNHISERVHFIEIEALTIECLFNYLNAKGVIEE